MTRIHQILIGVLVVQLVLVGVVFFVPKSGQAATAPLLGNTKAEDITSLTITDNTGASVRLSKSASGWVLPEADDFPADSTKITPVTAKLVALRAGRSVAQNESNFARLQVADGTYQRKIDIGTASGQTLALYVGASAGGSASYVRLGGAKDVYVGTGLTTYDVNADAASWIDVNYVQLTQSDITALTLKNAQGEFVFQKDAQGQWTMQGLGPGEVLSSNNLSTVLTYVASVRIKQPLGKTDKSEYGMAQPSAVVTVTTKTSDQEKTYTLTVGAHDTKDSTYYIKWSESPYYATIADYSVSEFVTRGKANFLQQPTPTPGPSPTPTPKS